MKPETRIRKFRLHRGRARTPKPPPDPPCPLDEWQIQQLGVFNAERARGLVHDDIWTARMARLQARYDRWLSDCADTWNAWAAGTTVPGWRDYAGKEGGQ